MGRGNIIEEIRRENVRTDLPDFQVGDTIAVSEKISEGAKGRIQVYRGIVTSIKGKKPRKSVSVYRYANKLGMVKLSLLDSPAVVKIEIESRGVVRRAKLNYLIGKSGKAMRVKRKLHTNS